MVWVWEIGKARLLARRGELLLGGDLVVVHLLPLLLDVLARGDHELVRRAHALEDRQVNAVHQDERGVDVDDAVLREVYGDGHVHRALACGDIFHLSRRGHDCKSVAYTRTLREGSGARRTWRLRE